MIGDKWTNGGYVCVCVCLYVLDRTELKVLVCKSPECHFGSEALKVVIMQKRQDVATTTATKPPQGTNPTCSIRKRTTVSECLNVTQSLRR